jgi:hypothetical protein
MMVGLLPAVNADGIRQQASTPNPGRRSTFSNNSNNNNVNNNMNNNSTALTTTTTTCSRYGHLISTSLFHIPRKSFGSFSDQTFDQSANGQESWFPENGQLNTYSKYLSVNH